jgi:hypothetical protein
MIAKTQMVSLIIVLAMASVAMYGLFRQQAFRPPVLAKLFAAGIVVSSAGVVLGIARGQRVHDILLLNDLTSWTRFFAFGLGLILAAVAGSVIWACSRTKS